MPVIQGVTIMELKAFLEERQRRALWAERVRGDTQAFIDALDHEERDAENKVERRLAVKYVRLLDEQIESTTNVMYVMELLFRDIGKAGPVEPPPRLN